MDSNQGLLPDLTLSPLQFSTHSNHILQLNKDAQPHGMWNINSTYPIVTSRLNLMGTWASWKTSMAFLFRISGLFVNKAPPCPTQTHPYTIHVHNVLTNSSEYSEFAVRVF